jgi:hypothetical protein
MLHSAAAPKNEKLLTEPQHLWSEIVIPLADKVISILSASTKYVRKNFIANQRYKELVIKFL